MHQLLVSQFNVLDTVIIAFPPNYTAGLLIKMDQTHRVLPEVLYGCSLGCNLLCGKITIIIITGLSLTYLLEVILIQLF